MKHKSIQKNKKQRRVKGDLILESDSVESSPELTEEDDLEIDKENLIDDNDIKSNYRLDNPLKNPEDKSESLFCD